MLAGIEVDEQSDPDMICGKESRNFIGGDQIIRQAGKAGARIFLYQLGQPFQFGPDGLIGQQYIGGAANGQHFSFRNGGALEFLDSRSDLAPGDFSELVCFCVWTKPRGVAGKTHHTPDIFLHTVGMDQQGRGLYVLHVFDQEPIVIRPRSFQSDLVPCSCFYK